MPNSNPRVRVKSVLRATGVMCCLAIGLLYVPRCIAWRHDNSQQEKAARAEITQLYNAIQPGDSWDKVREEFDRLNPVYVGIAAKDSQERIVFDTPGSFWADNWLLHVLFGDGKVETVAVRILDSAEEIPFDAPADKVSPTRPLERAFPAPYVHRPFRGYTARQQP